MSTVPEIAALLARMKDRSPARLDTALGDLSAIDALSLGDVWAVAQTVERAEHTIGAQLASAILSPLTELEPAFRGETCRDCLELAAHRAETEQNGPDGWRAFWHQAIFVLGRCVELSFDGLAAPARRLLLAGPDWMTMPHTALVLARLAGSAPAALEKLADDLGDSPLLQDELRVAAELELQAHLVLADIVAPARYRPDAETAERPFPLSAFARYAEFAEPGLRQAAERVRAIQDGTAPYAADKAFSLRESAVIGRLVRVALDRDEAWLPPILDELFRKVSVAPGTAKTVPSQSVAIAVGHAVEAYPTPEAVVTLRAVLRDIRHAGVEKKLQRNQRSAEKGLAERPEIALRLPADQPVGKAQLGTLARCLEAGLSLGLSLAHAEWRQRLADHPQAKALTTSLLWQVLGRGGSAVAVLPHADKRGLRLLDIDGQEVSADAESVFRLWHPSAVEPAERERWRDRMVALGLKQPFKQIFREHYIVAPEANDTMQTSMFAGHVVALRSLLGLARREGWRVEHDQGLLREIGPWILRLGLEGRVYPGATGWTTTERIGVWRGRGRKAEAEPLAALPAATRSEMLRSVDLLVSVSAFAMTTDDAPGWADPQRRTQLQRLSERPLGPMAEMRKQALSRILSAREGLAPILVDARHLRVGRYAIHLATGRVTRDGEPVVLETLPKSNLVAVPWLPYDEKLLELIARTALKLAADEA